MSKKILICGLSFLAGLCIFITGCEQNPKAIFYDSESATQTKLIKFNTTNAKYLATQWANELQGNRAAYGNLASDTDDVSASETLVAIVENENGELAEENVMELPKKELKLASFCQPQPVREVYKCPYPTIEYEAKGFYTVFSGYIDWWEYEDGSPAPNVGQIMYVKPNGIVVDILNFENDVKRYGATWIKENDGEEYIQFDENGNIFILTQDDFVGKKVVYRYNPMNDKVDGYTLDVSGDVEIRNFRVTRDGKWVFLNVMLRHQENNVYALQVNSKAKPITMYKFKGELPEAGEDPQWAVSSIEINPTTNEVYWYVDEYLDNIRRGSGLYVASRSTNGEYKAAKVKRYFSIPEWCLSGAVEEFVTGRKVTTPNYTGLLNYLKGMCNCDKDDVVFTLEYFKDRYEEITENNGNKFEKNYSYLYAEDSEGNPLTDEVALQYILSISISQATNGQKDDDSPLFELLKNYYFDYWREPQYEKGVLSSGSKGCLKEGFKNGSAFPWHKVLINKKTKEPAVELNFNKGYYSDNRGGIILANDEGVWVLSDYWDDNLQKNIYSRVFNITDEKGNFILDQPGDIMEQQFCLTNADKINNRKDTDPWFKKPFNANTTGIAALSIDKKTVYYHKEGVTRDLLSKDPNKANIEKIYSFNLEEDKLIYNAKTKAGPYIVVSIDLDTLEATKLPLTKQVESMMGMWASEESN